MKKIVSVLFAAVMAGAMMLMTACGGEDLQKQLDELTQQNEELLQKNQQLQSDASGLQEVLAELTAENALTEEELSELKYKFRVLQNCDWLHDAGYDVDMLYVGIKPEYIGREYTAEDFPDIQLSECILDGDDHYLLVLKHAEMKYLIDAVIKLLDYDFIRSVDLMYYDSGAV